LDPTNVPVQQYFHSKTLIPYQGNEWELDSDDEEEDEWRHQLQEELMDEFDDVSEREKLFMNAWNRFIHSDVVVPDSSLPGRCVDFLESHLAYLAEHGLRQQFLLHLLTLWDSSVLSSVAVRSVIGCFDDLVARRAAGPAEQGGGGGGGGGIVRAAWRDWSANPGGGSSDARERSGDDHMSGKKRKYSDPMEPICRATNPEQNVMTDVTP